MEKSCAEASVGRADTINRRKAAAERALEEAAARHRLAEASGRPPLEIDGRGGSDPVRYGDWEVKGLAVDF